jgi:hypothetical protein
VLKISPPPGFDPRTVQPVERRIIIRKLDIKGIRRREKDSYDYSVALLAF